MNKIYSNTFTVNFCDVGEKNELTNKGILRLMQEVAGQHSDSVGIGLNDTYKTGLAWIILNWKLKVFSRPKWNEALTISTWTKCEKNLFCYRDLKICDENSNVIAVAKSKWVLFDVNKKRISKVPEYVQEKFPDSDESVFNEKVNEKLKEPKNSEFVYEYKIQKRDIDTNHHVNNLNYIDYAYEALSDDFSSSNDFSNVEIMYKHEAKLGEIISIFISISSENDYIITIKDQERKNVHAIIHLYN